MITKTYLATAFCLLALSSTASANTVDLEFGALAACGHAGCDPVVFGVSTVYFTEGWGTILFASGNGQFAPISDGRLGFIGDPSSWYEYGEWDGLGAGVGGGYSGVGGGFAITGSMFGLDPGSLLLLGSFDWFSCGYWESRTNSDQSCDSAIRGDYVNPALLRGFGLPPILHFVGSLSGYAHDDAYGFQYSWVDVSVSATPVPEPSTLVLTGWGLMVSGLAYLRRRRNLG
jgi:hypothetical protein